MAKSKNNKTKYAVLAVFLGGLLLFFALGGHQHLSFEAMKESRTWLLEYTEQHYGLMLGAAFFTFTLATALSLPVATILSLAAGLLFGRWTGTAVIVISGTIGATLLLLAARYVFTDFLREKAARHVEKFDEGFRRNAFLYLAFLRVVPLFPFWLVNLVSAFTSISIPTYIGATAVGMVPISYVWASLGESLETIESPGDALSGGTLIGLTVLGIAGVAAILVKNHVMAKKGKSRR